MSANDPGFVGLDAEAWPLPPYPRRMLALTVRGHRLTMSTFSRIFADLYEDRPAFFLDRPIEYPFFRGDEISFRTLDRFASRVGNMLRAVGVRRGDRIGLATKNRIEIAFAQLGAQKIGAVPVPINYMLRAEEIQQLMSDSGCRVLVTDRAVFEENIRDTARVPSVETWIAVSDRRLPGFEDFSELVTRAPEELEPVELADSDLSVIFYTAGTTGLPKGAMLSSGALMFYFRYLCRIRGLLPPGKRDLALLVMPLAHIGGYQALLSHMALAYPTLLVGRFDPGAILDRIERDRVTLFSGIPTMYRMMLEAGAAARDLSSIERWGGGADRFPDELIVKLLELANRGKKKPNTAFSRGYGLTETAGPILVATGGPVGDGCLGKPLPGIKVALLGENGQPVADGEVGELVVRGPSLMKGYWNNSEMTEEAFRGGWFHTGDLAFRGKSGHYFVAARKKEMIKVGGYSVFPAEVENEMRAHPDIDQVAVVGLPHETKGERPAAAVVLKPGANTGADEILAWARERIAPYKCPRQVFLVDAIPLSSAMKMKRVEVREMLLDRTRGAA